MNKQSDLEFLTLNEGWPYWPWCPVKRQGVMGCVFCHGSSVYLRNVFSPPILLEEVEKISYPSLAALCEDGWVVD